MKPRLELNLSSDALYLQLSEAEIDQTLELASARVFCDLTADGELIGVEVIKLRDFLYTEPVKHELIVQLDQFVRDEMEQVDDEPADSLEIGLTEAQVKELLAAVSSAVEVEALFRIEGGLESMSTLVSMQEFHT